MDELIYREKSISKGGENMSKAIWKWVLHQQGDQKLSEVMNIIQAEIPGFRKGTRLPPRPMIIMHLMKPKNLERMANTSITMHRIVEEEYDLLTMTERELLGITNIPPSLILLKLLSEKEEDKANSLFEHWKVELGEAGLLKLEKDRQVAMEAWVASKENDKEMEAPPFQAESSQTASKDARKWEKVQKKLEQKLQTLQEELEKLQLEYRIYKDEQKEKEKEEKREYHRLKTEHGQLQHEHRTKILAYQVEKEEWKKEREGLLHQIETLEKETKHWKATLLTKEQKQVIKQEKKVKRKIYLLGNPHNRTIFQDCPYEVTIVEREEIGEVDFTKCQEIWGLTYKLDPQLLQSVQKQTKTFVKKIETFQQLKEEIEKGREEIAKQKVGS